MIIDCNVTLGNWPFRRVADSDPQAFVELMDCAGISQAWVSPAEAILYEVAQDANEALSTRLAGLQDRLVQAPVINPNFPAWEDDVAEYADWSLPGFRLYPSYHGYALEDTDLSRMVEMIEGTGRFVQIVVRVQDERLHHPLVMVEPVDLSPLQQLLRRFPRTPFVVLNAVGGEIRSLVAEGCPDNLLFDISHLEGVGGVGYLAQEIGAQHVLFGTHGPLQYVESALLKMREADLSEEDRGLILNGNAQRIAGGMVEAGGP